MTRECHAHPTLHPIAGQAGPTHGHLGECGWTPVYVLDEPALGRVVYLADTWEEKTTDRWREQPCRNMSNIKPPHPISIHTTPRVGLTSNIHNWENRSRLRYPRGQHSVGIAIIAPHYHHTHTHVHTSQQTHIHTFTYQNIHIHTHVGSPSLPRNITKPVRVSHCNGHG